jgi:uncharacterized protein YijF (DUF1287 family)
MGCAQALTPAPLPLKAPTDKNEALAYHAMKQVGVTKLYDPAYKTLAYPGGDVPLDRGVCTDVVIRALRKQKVDLQVLIHEDMLKSFSQYPQKWNLTKPDKNIDHRRVENIACYLKRKKKTLKVTDLAKDYKPGDIVTWQLMGGRPHIGIVSSQIAKGERYGMVHNIGNGAQLEDCLFAYKITGHFRYFH